MEIAATIINTILLLALFWYQKNKNKVLVDRISEQSSLLKETKDVVTNQAQAIESQKKVVDTALEYSNCFDIDKIELILKREIALDYQETIKEQESKIAEHEQSLEKANNAVRSSINYTTSNYIAPLSGALFDLLLAVSKDKREHVLSELPDSISKRFRLGLEEVDKKMSLSLGGLLCTNKSSNSDANGAGS